MKLTAKSLFKLFPVLSACLLCYFSYAKSGNLFLYYLLFHTVMLVYHLVFDQTKNKLFIGVISLLIASSSFGLFFTYFPSINPEAPYYYVATVQLFWMMGFMLMAVQLISDTYFKFRLNKRSFMILGILLLNGYFAMKIIDMVEVYNISSEHIIYSFSYTIVKMVIMSFGLIFFLMSSMKFQNTTFLVASFSCFFFSDIASTFNSLVFFDNTLGSLNILEAGLYCIAVALFYIYSILPKTINLMLYTELMAKKKHSAES